MSSSPLRRAVPAAAIIALLALSGCASPAQTTPSEPDAVGLLPAAEGDTAYPLTLSSWAGDTVLEERPERIAVIGFSTSVDYLQALDVTPVYTLTEDADYEWRDDAWFDRIETVDESTRRDPINFEGIAAAEPDLIIALNFLWEESDHQKLAAIAPVLEYEEQLGANDDWRAGQALVGEVLDLSAAAERVVDETDARIAEIAVAHPEYAGRTITVATDYGPEYGFEYYTSTGGSAERIFEELGFTPNPLAEGFVADPVISDENLALLEGDVLLVMYSSEEIRAEREAQALFQGLSQVVESRYVSLATPESDEMMLALPDGTIVSNPTWVLRRGASPVSLPWALEVITEQWLSTIEL